VDDAISISVIIPNYNREELLKKAIESAIAQTYQPLEILICDDGSTDSSKAIASGFDPVVVKWIDCGRNGRPSIPRNIGVQIARGNWVAFLDNDDVWLPTKLEEQVSCIQRNKGVKAVCTNGYRLRSSDETELFFNDLSDNLYTFQHFFNYNPVICSSVLISKKVMDDLSYFPEQMTFKAIEDYALWIRISTKFDFYYLDKPLLNYRDEEISDSIRKNFSSIEEIRKVIFPDLKRWLGERKISLSSRDCINLEKRLYLINNNKLDLLSRLYFIIRYKMVDWRILGLLCLTNLIYVLAEIWT
jgi:teichuronic acid biosynthesis glycosyltransferase TuaG